MIIISQKTDISGILDGTRTYILRQGTMHTIGVFRYRAKSHRPGAGNIRQGYIHRGDYTYNEEDRLVTLYPFQDERSLGISRNILQGMGFTQVELELKPQVKTMTEEEFIQLAKTLGCHNFHIMEGRVMLAIKGVSLNGGNHVVFRDIMELGAPRSLFCGVIKMSLRPGMSCQVPFREV